MSLERDGEGFRIDADLLGRLFDLPPSEVQMLMRSNRITSLCERGEGEDAGRYRLTFFHGSRRVRLSVDEAGRILKQSSVRFGERPLPPALRKPGGS